MSSTNPIDNLDAALARLTELELACAQAVEFATYVEQHAKGRMEDAAKRFLSLEFAQELAGALKAGREAAEEQVAIARFQGALDAAGNTSLKVLAAEFKGSELEGTIADARDVTHVGALFSESRTLEHLASLLVQQAKARAHGR